MNGASHKIIQDGTLFKKVFSSITIYFFYGHSLKFVENCIIEISQALCYKILKFKVFKYFIQL